MSRTTPQQDAMLEALYDEHIRIQRERADEALAQCGYETLAVYAGGERIQFLDDQAYPFKPNPHFKLFTPLVNPVGCWIVHRPGQRLKLVFVRPEDFWFMPGEIPTAAWTRHFDIEIVRQAHDARAHVAGLPHCAFIGEEQPEFRDWGFAASNPQPLLDRLHYLRAVKTAYEIECMRDASARAARGHRAAEAAFREGASEYEIHMAYLIAAGHTESELPYSNIVALNRHAAVLHYQHQQRQTPALAERRSFLIDAGASCNGYACDITRTYSYVDDEFAAMIEGMHKLQLALCDQVRSGVDYASIHLDAHLRIATLLRESGVITMAPEDALACGLSGVFFPHGVGHLLGLQVHDPAGRLAAPDGAQKDPPAGHPFLRLTRTLEPGFVVTIEPGLYFIDMLLEQARASEHARYIDWRAVERFHPCGGVRIEDNVACTTGDPDNLTRPAFLALSGPLAAR
ncbi:MAG TPA: Xaa-Pro dipeptidase [Steroidobacter sp.]|nr:Xaa-Pro dipeptidase [Steroidobacteraceae bacterium]HLS82395.1 Xaa-Pro dipeptidase [Steroidobacter sp.]